jgi:hypothetical protein
LLLFALASFVSAESPVKLNNIVTPTTGVSTGQNFDVKFVINNTHASSNFTNVTLTYTDMKNDPFAALSAVTVGSTSIPVTTTVVNSNLIAYSSALNINVLNKTASQEITLTFTVNPSAISKIHSRTIAIVGDLVGESRAEMAVSLNLNVVQMPRIALTKIVDLAVNKSAIMNITNTGNIRVNSISLTSSGAVPVSFSDNNFGLNYRESRIVNVSATDVSGLKFGSNIITVSATGDNGGSAQLQLNLKKTFCKSGEIGSNLSISSFQINNIDGDDDDIWKPLDKIKINFDVNNDGDDRISTVYAELGLFNPNGRNIVKDLSFTGLNNEKINLGSISEDDDKEASFEFTVPTDFKEDSYRVAVKTYSKASGLGEDRLCIDSSSDITAGFYEEITVERESEEGKLITFNDAEITPSEAMCGSKVVLNFDVINIGTEDQDQVKINLVNTELGLSKSQEIRENLNSGDSKSLSFTFDVPTSATTRTYVLNLGAEYDYNSGRYREVTSDPVEVSLKVVCANVPGGSAGQPNALINAALASNSQSKAGSEMTINVRITNAGTNSSTFIIGAKNYESWADIKSISERLISLNPRESRDITMVFNVNKDASGEKSFVIESLSDGKSETKEVVVEIQGTNAAGGSSLFASLKSNSLVWIIGLVNLVLIILIIIVAVRVSRR